MQAQVFKPVPQGLQEKGVVGSRAKRTGRKSVSQKMKGDEQLLGALQFGK